MARGKKKDKRENPEGNGQRRGKRRSIRFEAVEEYPEDRGPVRDPDAPPVVLLRKLHLEDALIRLESQLLAHAGQGQSEVVVVHGKGTNSARGIPVLGPAVRQWCDQHRDLVASWREAPGKWGGAGAIVVTLRNV